MKIIFSSNVHGQTGTTTNMLAVAVMSNILYKRRSILLQTQFHLNQLEVPLLPVIKRKEAVSCKLGMDELLKGIQAGKSTQELLKACCISLSEHGLDFLPGTNMVNREIYEEGLTAGLYELLQLAEQFYELVFIDIGPIQNQLAEQIWKEADISIINLSQNIRVLDDFFTTHNPPKEAVYLLGFYDWKSTLNKKTLTRLYKPLKEENTFVIPYNTELRDSVSEAKLNQFFLQNMYCEPEDENYYFVEEVKKIVAYLMFLTDQNAGKQRNEYQENRYRR